MGYFLQRLTRYQAEKIAQVTRIKEWTIRLFGLPKETRILVDEQDNQKIGFPWIETLITIEDGSMAQPYFRISKPVFEILERDFLALKKHHLQPGQIPKNSKE